MSVFAGSWRIGERQPGAQALSLHLTVGTTNRLIIGTAEMYTDYPTNPFNSAVVGHFDPVFIPGHGHGFTFAINGHLPIFYGQTNQQAPDGPNNLRVTMTLGETMKSGTATYSYLDPDGDWKTVGSLPAEFEQPPGPDIYSTPAPTLTP